MTAEIFERRTPVIGSRDGVSLVLQDLSQCFDCVDIVVDHEDSKFAGFQGDASHEIRRPRCIPCASSSLKIAQ
jgi:hypothetical protein